MNNPQHWKVISITGMLDWQRCQRLYWLRHERRLRPLERNPMMASGSAAHQAIAFRIRGRCGAEAAEQYATTILGVELNGDEAQVDKYLPGMLRALGRVPQWVWETPGWHVEELVEVVVHNWAVRGKPDLFRIDDKGILSIVEFKSTDTSPTEFLLWNPQHRYYAVILHQLYHPVLTQIKYVCLPTAPNKSLIDHDPWPITPPMLEYAREEMGVILDTIGGSPVGPTYGRHCSFCEFANYCTIRLTGRDGESILEEEFEERERTP